MNVLGHHNEDMKQKTPFPTVSIYGFQEEANVIFDNKESSSLPRRECDEISSGRRDEASRFQKQTSAAKAAFAQGISARVKLVPFPVDFLESRFCFGKNTK